MKEIKLTQDKVALVDDEDFESLSKFNWYARKDGNRWYVVRSVYDTETKKGSSILMHRFILGIDSKKFDVDHVDGNCLNNTRSNLRICERGENNKNKQRQHINNTSGYRGVTKRPNGKWQVKVGSKYCGVYETVEEAAKVYNENAKELFGDFHGKLNLEK